MHSRLRRPEEDPAADEPPVPARAAAAALLDEPLLRDDPVGFFSFLFPPPSP